MMLRMTRQRLLILEELMKLKNHPTAYEMHAIVKQSMPQISLATVYRNLEQLSACGRIQRLAFGSGKRRYDGNADVHHHLCCLDCGRVDDLPSEHEIEQVLNTMLDEVCGYRVTGISIEIYGTCPACKAQKIKRQKPR
jgi:Fur family ferric uptake transcriptional regulator